MLSVTLDQVLDWGSCYEDEKIVALFAGRDRLTALDIIGLDIPAADRIWAVLCPELIPKMTLHGLACDFAERALLAARAAGREPDFASWNAIAVKRRWISGEASDAELEAAWASAEAAARAALEAALEAAAWAAAEASAEAAEEERLWQLARIREVLEVQH